MSTTFPIDVTLDRLIEFLAGPGRGTIRSISLQEIGRDVFTDPSPTSDDSAGAQMLLMVLQGQTGEQVRDWLHTSDEAAAWRARPPAPAPADGEEHGVIRIDRPAMRDEDGACWQWRGFTDFLLYLRWLQEGPSAAMEALIVERLALGANVLRVLGMVNSFAHLWPQEHANYYTELPTFAAWLAERGIRCEFVVFADAQFIMPDAQQRREHLARVVHVLGATVEWEAAWNIFIEVANEPFQNLPGGDQEAVDLAAAVVGTTDVLIASGAYSTWPPLPTQADYGTTHCARSPDWPRKCKDAKDLTDASGGVPWIGDEPMGCDETASGSRDPNPDNHAWYAAGAQMFSPGATFHCQDGINSRSPIGPVQTTCAKAFFEALGWMPREALLWPYQRGDAGSEAGIGNMPILHDDALETRSYCKTNGGQSWCIQVQTTRAHATPRDGWRVVSEPRKGFVYLEKQ